MGILINKIWLEEICLLLIVDLLSSGSGSGVDGGFED